MYLFSKRIGSFWIFSFQLPGKLNELEPQTNLSPLEIALNERQESIAKTLVHHSCDVNAPDKDGRTLLHRFMEVGDDYAARFLIEHGADVKAVTYDKNETVLHQVASYKYVEDTCWSLSVHDITVVFLSRSLKIIKRTVACQALNWVHRSV